MNYYITRDGQQYGPYTLADLQRYVASGEVLLTDMARSEGMTEALPVSQIIGTISVPQASTSAGAVSVYNVYPDPPNLHWGLVILFGFLSCGLFFTVWEVVLAAWMKKVSPSSKAIYYFAVSLLILVSVFTMSFMASLHHTPNPLLGVLEIANFVVILIGRFNLKASLEEHYNTAEPMGLLLSGVMTFFFGSIYFQYHLNDIVRRKSFDRLSYSGV